MEVQLYVKREHSCGDSINFEDFLEQKGFRIQDIIEGNLEHRSKEDVLSVAQGWAFFGTIISIRRLVSVPVDVNDSVR
jgi:hypothetical protein